MWRELQDAKDIASQSHRQLWQVFQAPPHDLESINLETTELVFLIDHKQFDLMESYRLVTVWTANLTPVTPEVRSNAAGLPEQRSE